VAEKKHKLYSTATLFSGAGGLDTGFAESKNFKMLLANDVLLTPAESYSKNYRHQLVEAKNFGKKTKLPAYVVGDITNINFKTLGNLDCMVGGPPCQDFSITRGGNEKRKGITVTRGELYLQYVRAIKETKPKVFAFENVPGLVSANGGQAYKTILHDFENLRQVEKTELKYRIIFNSVVDATKIGVPQSRRRLIIIGVRSDLLDWPTEAEIAQKAENILSGKNSLVSKYPLTAMEAFEGKTLPELAGKYIEIMKEFKGSVKTANTEESNKWKTKVWDKLSFDVVDDYLFSNKITPKDDDEIEVAFEEHRKILQELGYYGKSLTGTNFSDGSNEIPNEGSEVLDRMRVIPPGMNHLFVEGTKWAVKGRMSNIYRRTDPLKPAFTVLAYGGGGTWSYHYEKGRGALTNRERARLQTFPDAYVFGGNRSEVRAQIGEAVPVRLGKKIAEVARFILEKV